MPKRPRSHQIETESRNAFHNAIPTRWVTRDISQDYGIDVEVEVFDENDTATGDKFLAQLRATDEPELARALSVRLSADAVSYYRSLDLPVLIVRYHSPTGSLYSRWLHTYDPYYVRKGSKSTTLNMAETDRWRGDHHRILRREVKAYREVHRAEPPQLLTLSLRMTLGELEAADKIGFMLRLRERLRETAILDAVFDDELHDRAIHSITISDELIQIKFAGENGIALHAPKGQRVAIAPELSADVLTGIGISLDKFGYSVAGAEVLSHSASQSKLLHLEAPAGLIMQCFVRARQAHRAIELAASQIGLRGGSDALQLLLGGPILKGTSMSTTERRLCAEAMRRAADAVATSGDSRLAATLFYNSGRVLSSPSETRAILHAYRRAARLYPDYKNRAYFWRELAGLLFMKGRFAASARYYERALTLQREPDTGCLLADACLFAGRYGDALALFSAHIDSANTGHAEWMLKKFAIPALIRVIGSEQQQRSANAADLLMASQSESEATCHAAFAADALNAHAWFNLGVTRWQHGREADALNCFLLSALISQIDLEAWCNTIILALRLNQPEVLGACVFVAHFFNSESFLAELHIRVFAQFVDAGDASLVRALGDAIAKAQAAPDFRVRFHLEGGGFDELRLGGAQPSEE